MKGGEWSGEDTVRRESGRSSHRSFTGSNEDIYHFERISLGMFGQKLVIHCTQFTGGGRYPFGAMESAPEFVRTDRASTGSSTGANAER